MTYTRYSPREELANTLTHAAGALLSLIAGVALVLLAAPTADPCNVARDVIVSNGSTIDLGARGLVVKRGKSIDVGSGLMTIRAGSLVIEPGAAIMGRGLNGALGGTVQIEIAGTEEVLAAWGRA